MLHTFTADVLKMALLAFGGGALALQFYYPATLSLVSSLTQLAAFGATVALPASQLFASEADRSRVNRDFRVRARSDQ